ncbi:hypothetical protein EIN_025140 [Entamoeba invadens IP1]|uniref:hypothetical protein n=1 Tax=Entamoeba invadens IP1 TaxID=370355 RepID=UPI0002C3CF35|nr:hypothetical protein EIN_025140 [Entamoeba invadens IP1]ELP90715.1 hypothetical protein EIN_025140 [Entamoeba invadens IP1]|eukprot:XP_004257486.1 hypothetical protein EIN_025140 [Entamoeba invadens IP1]
MDNGSKIATSTTQVSIPKPDPTERAQPGNPTDMSPYQSFTPYVPQNVMFKTEPPQFPQSYVDDIYTPIHRRKKKFQNIDYSKLLSEDDLQSMTLEEFDDYTNELKDRRTLTKNERATLNKIKRKLKNKESARKSRQKSKEAFSQLQEQLEELQKQYDDVLRINCKLVRVADECPECSKKIRQVQSAIQNFSQITAIPPS